jgi:hypothetical protein
MSQVRVSSLDCDIILPFRPSSQGDHCNRNKIYKKGATMCGLHRKTGVGGGAGGHVRRCAVPTGKQERERVRAAMCADVRSTLDPHRKL